MKKKIGIATIIFLLFGACVLIYTQAGAWSVALFLGIIIFAGLLSLFLTWCFS